MGGMILRDDWEMRSMLLGRVPRYGRESIR